MDCRDSPDSADFLFTQLGVGIQLIDKLIIQLGYALHQFSFRHQNLKIGGDLVSPVSGGLARKIVNHHHDISDRI